MFDAELSTDVAGSPDLAAARQLVDLNIPEVDTGEQDRNTLRTSGQTSNTSLTVLHTPHRLSHSTITPAAVELFENGVDFNGQSSAEKFQA